MAEHVLKTNSEYWDAIADGRKNFQVRRDDRGFQCGDTLVLVRYARNTVTGVRHIDSVGVKTKELRRRITYILTGGQFGIEPGYVVIGLGDGD